MLCQKKRKRDKESKKERKKKRKERKKRRKEKKEGKKEKKRKKKKTDCIMSEVCCPNDLQKMCTFAAALKTHLEIAGTNTGKMSAGNEGAVKPGTAVYNLSPASFDTTSSSTICKIHVRRIISGDRRSALRVGTIKTDPVLLCATWSSHQIDSFVCLGEKITNDKISTEDTTRPSALQQM